MLCTRHVVTVEKRVGLYDKSRVDVSILNYVEERNIENHPIETKTAHLDFAMTNPTGASNLKLRLIRGAAAKAYATKKMQSPGAQNVMAPDTFIPCILETFGLMHWSLRKLLSNIANSHIYLSVMDAGYSAQQTEFLKGAVVNSYYELISVAGMKGVICNIHSAVRTLLRKCDVATGKGPPLTSARAWGIITTAEKTATSNTAEFF